MIISLNWISDFVDVSDYLSHPQDLADLLTSVGLEVEGIEDPSRQFQNVVVGHIVEKDQHPNADRLTLCQVDVGGQGLKQIVCGATNHNKGDKVVVALPGAVLPGDFEIKLSKIRGIESSGMLCSKSELDLAKESEGIMILPPGALIGQSFAEYYGLNDVLLEINVTPNRADCLSHYGLAREISAILGRPLKKISFAEKGNPEVRVQSQIQLEVKDSDLCPRYMGKFISGVRVEPSSSWLRQRLESVGMNSINNVVDVTNYVMMELGQPLHAFDFSQLKDQKVRVEKAHGHEKFTSLDGTVLELSGQELTIRDGERPVCLAGVVGGQNSGVTESTTDIFLESAHFSMESVRKTSRQYGLQTDSAYRFSRGTDISMVDVALHRASELLVQECGGQMSGDVYDVYPSPKQTSTIAVRYQYVTERLGYEVKPKDFNSWMERLGLRLLESTGEEKALFEVPLHRGDLEQEVDLVEEYGRLNGYDKIPDELPLFGAEPLAHDDLYQLETSLTKAMISLGYSEAVNYGFTSDQWQSRLFGDGHSLRQARLNFPLEKVFLQNPLSEELNVMRLSLLPGLLSNLFHNVRYGNKLGRLFEVGSRYFKEGESYLEEPMMGWVAWGETESLWNKSSSSPLFYEVKASLEKVFQYFRLGGAKGWLQEPLFSSLELRAWDENTPAFLHPGQSAVIFCEGQNIGFLGSLHPQWLGEFKVKVPVVVGEIQTSLFQRTLSQIPKSKMPSKFQSVERDLAFIVKEELAASQLLQVIKKVAGPYLQMITVTDEFRGGDVPEGSKSLSLRMTLLDEKGTLNDKQLMDLQNQMIQQAEKKLGVKLR